MIMPRYKFVHPWWHYFLSLQDLSNDGHYFIFVEEARTVATDELLGPDDEPISSKVALGENPWRFRSSGIEVLKFLQMMDRIEPLDHENITNDQRRRRRGQLVDEFGSTPLPLLDLYINEKNEDLPFLRASLTPGSWYWIGVSRADEGDGLPIFVGAPELEPGPYLPGALRFLEAVPPFLEYRLRDIFSLVHVADAGIEEIGGGSVPPPDKPPEPDDTELSPSPQKLDFKQESDFQEYEA